MQTITIKDASGKTTVLEVNGEITINGKPIEPPVKEKQYPWEKSFERVCVGKVSFYVGGGNCSIIKDKPDSVLDSNKNVIPTESIALSVLAYTQLRVITTDMNGTDEMLTPEMNGGRTYSPCYNYTEKKFNVESRSSTCISPFPVRTPDLCQQLIDENTELLEQFYEIKK